MNYYILWTKVRDLRDKLGYTSCSSREALSLALKELDRENLPLLSLTSGGRNANQ